MKSFPPGAPIDAGQMFAQGFALHQQGRLAEAGACYAAVLRVLPNHFDALHLSGVIAHGHGDDRLSEQLIRRALKLNPGYSDAWSNLGQALAGQGQPVEAIKAYDRALALNPDNAAALFNRGSARSEIGHHAAALADFDRLLELVPDYVEAHNFRSVALCGLERYADAIAAASRALELRPGMPEALVNRAAGLRILNRHTAAVRDLTEALAQDPDWEYPRSALPAVRMMTCDWTDIGRAMADLRHELNAPGKRRGAGPLDVLALSDDPADVLASGRDAARRLVDAITGKIKVPRMRRHPDGRIRIAYISSDFGEHPVAHLISEALELHDRSRFEIHGISLLWRPGKQNERIRLACEHYHEITGLPDDAAVDLIRAMDIDIAVNLNGYTGGERNGIFARRAAPIQANFLGFAATMGAEFIDYAIVDPVLAPPGAEVDYAEKLVRLPICYQPSDTTREISARPMSRSEWGLPDEGFVFCSFNNNFKIMPDIFGCWMGLLHDVKGSVLWLRGGNADAERNLRTAAQAHGIDPTRLVFAKFADLDEHNARHRLADLFLDTFPYNAHTTANDALWSGLPVLTLAGKCYHSRVAASLLHAIGLPELVTRSLEDYAALARELARDPVRLAAITQRLRANRDGSALFNMPAWVASLEQAYAEMARRAQSGLKPDAITLDPASFSGPADAAQG